MTSSQRIAVVGAGVAGLTAARELAAAGHDVVVIEARDRVGGRTHTVELGGAPADLGGSWIHGPIGNPLSPVVDAAGLATVNDGAWGGAMRIVVEGHGELDGPDTATVITSQFDWDPAEAAAALGRDGSFDEGVAWYLDDRGYTGAAREAIEFALRWSEAGQNIAGTPDRVSLEGTAGYVDLPGGNVAIVGGYRRLVDHLADGLQIRLGEPVRRIRHDRDGVVLTTDLGDHAVDQVVVTAPLGVLAARTIEFDPPLPELFEHVDRLAMGSLEKVVFRFAERFWPANVRRMLLASSHRRYSGWVDISAHAGVPTLVVFLNPRNADAGPLSERPGRALDSLRSMLGPDVDVPEPVVAHATDWMHDPFALGSYSYVPVGGSPDDMAAIGGRWSSRLVFAGEHTVPAFFGTVHGAHLSGLRAAETISMPRGRDRQGAAPDLRE